MDATSQRIHRNNFHLYLRQPTNKQQILIKEPASQRPTPSIIQQLSNEYTITRKLAAVPGVRKVYKREGTEHHPRLVLQYISGHTLADLNREASLDLDAKLCMAQEVAGILARIHDNHVIHGDINPGNILVSDDLDPSGEGRVYITDFGLASVAALESPDSLAGSGELAATLAYMSPEQTGRMNRLVDYRTDLYSLGVTLYELFAGELPFQANDALEMIHGHIARQPVPPHELDAEIPRSVSDIILKLLAKNAEDRYQTARGLQSDLKTCLDQWQTSRQIVAFELGRDDFTGRLQIPQKLYGRQTEIDQLLTTFDRIARGKAELLLVAGYAGVGKTSLIHGIHKPITAKRGYFIEGKFDQYRRSIPYSAWLQIFSKLVGSWLAESESCLDQRRAKILEAVGQNGQVLIDVIPNLELLIGPQPEVPELGGREAQNRFNYLFQCFARSMATPDQPLVVFLDDVQWIDLASLDLLKTLLTDQDITSLLVIAAYRNNEVDPTHPLILGINDLRETGAIVNQLTLGDLAWEDINRLLSDSLHTPTEQCLPLAQLVQAKTGGNAFFTHQLLHVLEDDGMLSFDRECACWQWDMAELKQLPISDNIVDLLLNKLHQLPVATQDVLKTAACLGNQFDTEIVSLVSELSPDATQRALEPAYQEGFLISVEGFGSFAHDRIQQAAYALIAESAEAPLHQKIGRALLEETPRQDQPEHLFDIVGHLNMGASLIETEADRVELAELNLKAAQHALRTAAYAAAASYAKAGIGILLESGWQTHYSLARNLHQLAAEAAYLNLDYEQSEQCIATILANAQSLIDRIPACIIQIRVYTAQNLNAKAIETGLAVLDELGVTLQESAPAGAAVQALSELSPMTDPKASATAIILNSLLMPAYNTRPELFSRLIYTALCHILEFGVHPSSCTIIIFYAMLNASENIDRAYQFGELALQLVEKLNADRYMCQVKGSFEVYLSPWKSHYQTVERALRNSVQIGLETGDKAYAMAGLVNASALNFVLRDRLDQAQENMTQDFRLLQGSGEDFLLFYALIWAQFVANLRGRSQDPLRFEGPRFDEASDLPLAQAAGQYQITYYLHLLKGILHYHLGHFQAAFAYSEEAEPFLSLLGSHFLIHLLPFYQSLAILQLSNGQGQPAKLVEKLEQNLQQLQLWAKHAPMNHRHKVDLILAERARIAGDVAGAIGHYEAAITGARENEYPCEQALATELYGRFWDQRGNDSIARLYLSRAHALYGDWGATTIVEHLEEQYPQLLEIEMLNASPPQPSVSISELSGNLDFHSVLKSTQIISHEIVLDRLLSKVMDVAMENVGADRGFLVLEREGQWVIDAAAGAEMAERHVLGSQSIDETELLSAGIINFVARTQRPVRLNDAAREGAFVSDPYIQSHQAKSVLCVPLIYQGEVNGILYLENNLASRVFTEERVELLQLLSSQMANSIQHARLYDKLEEEVMERTQALVGAETQIRTLFENTFLGIALTTYSGDVLAANQALLRMTGYSDSEMRQLNVNKLYDEPRERNKMMQRLRAGQTVRDFGVQGRRKDGTRFFASLDVSPITRGADEILLAVVEDVTELVRTERALQESQQLYLSALNSLSASIAVLDETGLIIAVNLSWREFADENGLVWADYGVGRSYLAVVDAATGSSTPGASEVSNRIRQLLSGERGEFSIEYACHSPSKDRWFEMRATRIESDQGVRVTVAHQNITEKKQAEMQLEQAAVQSERERLARELHDSVTQTLFSASVIAEATPRIWDKDHATAQKNMEQLAVMMRGALAEMRTLLLELRPGAMGEQSWRQLLDVLAQAARANTKAKISVGVMGNRSLPEDVAIALHRIARESLNNAIQHAEARKIEIRLNFKPHGLVLYVGDDGRGFDLESIPPGHLGIDIMAERARAIEATFQIKSEVGAGTLVVITWSDPGERRVHEWSNTHQGDGRR